MITVLILAAGYGRRMGHFSRMINKGLVPYDNKPLISHIMEKFESNTKFVIACGHMGQQLKDYVSLVHSEKNVVYVDIENYAEGVTGPATTIQTCYEYISGPFIWLSCDTLFEFDYKSKLDHNWIGVHPIDSSISQDYCWVERDGDIITKIENKKANKSAVDAFIGLMYCKDSTYVDNLKSVGAKEALEGMKENLKLKAHTVKKWYDFGTYNKWLELSKDLKEISFPKPNEIFYQDNKKIIKFTVDKVLAERKLNRATMNTECMPNNVDCKGQFLVYDYVKGDIIYKQLTPEIFDSLLYWADTKLWKRKWFPDIDNISRLFYYNKTVDRLHQFRTKYSNWDEPVMVNSVPVKSIDIYLSKINWDWLCKTNEWAFIHGDFQFENIIFNADNNKFTCIDWRTDFGGDKYGDVYYDIAKMMGGILLDYQAVKEHKLQFAEDNSVAILNDCSIDDADQYVEQLKNWCLDKNLDWNKIQLLVAIIYLNMSPLHDAPFDKYLFALAQLHFAKYFNEH